MESTGSSTAESTSQANVLVLGAAYIEAWSSEGHDLSEGGQRWTGLFLQSTKPRNQDDRIPSGRRTRPVRTCSSVLHVQ